MDEYSKHITKAIANITSTVKKETPTHKKEASAWKELLEKHDQGYVYVRKGWEVTTPIGTFPSCRDEELFLNEKYDPPLNYRK